MDSQEFLAAYDEYADALFRHCYYRVSDREIAKDLVQETFVRTWKYVADGGKVKNVRAFLYRVAHNLIVDIWKKKKSVSFDELAEKGFDPKDERVGSDLERMMIAKDALRLLDMLEESYREIIVMRYIDDLSPREIAKIMGVSENTVSVRIHRALKKIRELLEHE